MRIVHLIWALNVGGAETMLVDIAREQSVANKVYIVVLNNQYHESVVSSLTKKICIINLNRPVSSRNPLFLLKLHHILYQLRPDILHAHGERIVDMIPFRRVPIVATIHSTGIKQPRSIQKYQKIFCISEAVKEDLIKRYEGLEPTVVHNGINFSFIRQKENYGNMPFRVIQVGRLDHQLKGQDITLRALHRIVEKIGGGFLTVDFIGEGKSLQFLKNLASELGVEKWCRFLGLRSRQELYNILCNYDLLIQPSRSEGFGLTIVEGMAAKIPVLVSDIEGPMEIIDRGCHGFFFRRENFEDCTDRIIEIMELSRSEEITKKIKEAYEYAKSRFDIRITAKKYLLEYQKIISVTTKKD